MSKEQNYIDALQNFSKSINMYIDAIKSQVGNTETLKELIGSSKQQTQIILENAKKLSVIEENTEETKTRTQEILSILKKNTKDTKRGKNKDPYEILSSKDKAKKVKDSAKTIALMAGGILAIGGAFKIIGDVDFKSVMALSLALPAVSFAFNKVGENIENPKDAMLTSLSMIVMSAGILGSGHLLSMMPQISIGSLLTSIGVSASMGIAMYAMSTATKDVEDSDIKRLYMMIPILPTLAGSVVGAGLILQNMPSLTISQVLSTAGVGIAMGATMVPLSLAAKAIGGNTKELVLLSLSMPIIAGGIVGSGMVLQHIPELPISRIMGGSIAVASSTLAISGTLWTLAKMKLGLKEVTTGTLSMTIMSGGLMAMSHILSIGNYSKGPSVEWASGVGLAMLGYLPGVLITGAIAATGFGALVILAGVASMLAIGGGLAAVSHKIAGGKYSGGPSEEWAKGVGLSLMAFVDPILKLNPSLIGMLLGDTLSAKIAAIEDIGVALNNTSHKIAGGKYSGGPSEEWAKGVGLSLMAFAATMETVEPGLLDKLIFGTSLDDKLESMIKVAETLPKIGKAVGQKTDMYDGGPKPEWAEGSAASILKFATALDTITGGWFKKDLTKQLDGMVEVAKILPRIGEAVTNDKTMYGGGPEKEWVENITTTLGAFNDVFSTNKRWAKGGKKLTAGLDAMVDVAKVLPRIGEAVGNRTDLYLGGPEEDWSNRIGLGISSFANAMSGNNLSIEEFKNSLPSIIGISRIMRIYADAFQGADFSHYPSNKWSKSITTFIGEFTSIKGINNTENASREIYRLAFAYRKLSDSLSGITDVMQNMPNKVPDVSGLYAGLVTLSLIDDSKLKNVLDALDKHRGNLSDTMGSIIKASNLNIESNYSINKTGQFDGLLNFDKVTSQKANSISGLGMNPFINSNNTQVNETVPIDKEIKLDTQELENKIQEMTNLLNNVVQALNIIADNTTKEQEISGLLNY